MVTMLFILSMSIAIEKYNLADEFGGVYDLEKSGIQAFQGAVLSLRHLAYVKYHILDSLAPVVLIRIPGFIILFSSPKR